MNTGMQVNLTLSARWGDKSVTLRNVTEVHYNYPAFPSKQRRGKVAFESDIHGTGITYDIKDVVEFEVTPETHVAESFYQ